MAAALWCTRLAGRAVGLPLLACQANTAAAPGLLRLEAGLGSRLRALHQSQQPGLAAPASKDAASDEGPGQLKTTADGSKSTTLLTALSSVWGGSKMAEPELTVASNGLGSVVHVTLPPHSFVYGKRGCLMACSTDVSSKVATKGGVLRSVSRKLAGGDFFMESHYAGGEMSDVLLSPKGIGDVAIINLDGTATYSVTGGACLALSPHLFVRAASPLEQLTKTGLRSLHVSGRGQLAVTSYGGIFRLVLEDGHSYRVSTKHLLAWESSMAPEALRDEGDVSDDRHVVVRYFQSALGLLRRPFQTQTSMCVLHGPGDFFLASRVEPSFSTFKRSAQNEVEQYVTVKASAQVQEAVEQQEKRMREQIEREQTAKDASTSASATAASRKDSSTPPSPSSPAPPKPQAAATKPDPAEGQEQPAQLKPGPEAEGAPTRAWWAFWKR